jgi:hypothetical protein
MSQSTIQAGDLVKYHKNEPSLTEVDFSLGQIYEIQKDFQGDLVVRTQLATIALSIMGELTDNADHFTKVYCPVVLPRGKA